MVECSPTCAPATHSPPAALGDVGSSKLALTLADRVRDFPHTDYQSQELSNVVWALGTLGMLCVPTLDAVLAGVSCRGAVKGAEVAC